MVSPIIDQRAKASAVEVGLGKIPFNAVHSVSVSVQDPDPEFI